MTAAELGACLARIDRALRIRCIRTRRSIAIAIALLQVPL